MQDCAYHNSPCPLPTLSHCYGEHVHVLKEPVLLLQLAQLSAPHAPPAQITQLVRSLYGTLLRHVLNHSWPRAHSHVATRMRAHTERGVWHGHLPDAQVQTVVLAIARAGTVPAQQVYDGLCTLFGGAQVRQDHLVMNRELDAAGKVAGVSVHGSKIGGDVAGRTVLIPDPMGATGTSMAEAVAIYKAAPGGPPARILALHLIVTPEYLAHMKRMHPDVAVWALRLDRGMSSAHILATEPGSCWAEERGLNAHQYIVPGAGGLGELLSNAER